jgi:hypothetical protein
MGKPLKGWTVSKLRQFIYDALRGMTLLKVNPYVGSAQETPIVNTRVATGRTFVLINNSEISGVLYIETGGVALVSDI